jgi:hypothetical protein
LTKGIIQSSMEAKKLSLRVEVHSLDVEGWLQSQLSVDLKHVGHTGEAVELCVDTGVTFSCFRSSPLFSFPCLLHVLVFPSLPKFVNGSKLFVQFFFMLEYSRTCSTLQND